MKKCFYILFILIFFMQTVNAKSINAAAYRTMQAQSYRNNYYRQTRPMPYWQAQSNYATRGRSYQNYANYSRYMNNAMYGSSYGYRGYR